MQREVNPSSFCISIDIINERQEVNLYCSRTENKKFKPFLQSALTNTKYFNDRYRVSVFSFTSKAVNSYNLTQAVELKFYFSNVNP